MRGLTLWQILIIAISLCEPVYAKEYRVQDAPECAVSLSVALNEIIAILISPDEMPRQVPRKTDIL